MSFFSCDSEESDSYSYSNNCYYGIYSRNPAEVALSIPRPKNPFHNYGQNLQCQQNNMTYQNCNSAFGMPMTSF